MKYKEGFSTSLIDHLLDVTSPRSVLDPFSGIGTTPLVSAGRGLKATGIEILPVASLTAKAIAVAANGLKTMQFKKSANELVKHLGRDVKSRTEYAFPHFRITEAAFPARTESQLAKAREFLSYIDDPDIHTMLNVACMSVLESASFTRKDGQYLRWDSRSGKSSSKRNQHIPITRFDEALSSRLHEMTEDIKPLQKQLGGGMPDFIEGSSLNHLRQLSEDSFDMVITSPPYANRYDYTRTYALELAWIGFDDDKLKNLRQRLLSATVENKPKLQWLQACYRDSPVLKSAVAMFGEQRVLQEVLSELKKSQKQLSNSNIVRMLEGYFLEMAVVIAELGRIVRPGGTVIMVNDNVQYHGHELPVDLILSDFAENSGFLCANIWALTRRKGNSSQQMGRFGRRELRKGVYRWVKETS
ncbi:site-specific DNA-methyltransferase [Candidatus Poribacteria bacterium]|nr:site-specific DNA-methyltransferase [Candidatus Poribacteria bacterium]